MYVNRVYAQYIANGNAIKVSSITYGLNFIKIGTICVKKILKFSVEIYLRKPYDILYF